MAWKLKARDRKAEQGVQQGIGRGGQLRLRLDDWGSGRWNSVVPGSWDWQWLREPWWPCLLLGTPCVPVKMASRVPSKGDCWASAWLLVQSIEDSEGLGQTGSGLAVTGKAGDGLVATGQAGYRLTTPRLINNMAGVLAGWKLVGWRLAGQDADWTMMTLDEK